MPVPLSNQICFTLYATSMAITRTYKPMLDAMAITYPQYLVLSVLGDGDGATVGGIADRLALESSTVTPLVQRLELAGLVMCQRSTVDKRQVQVWLTAAGRTRLIDAECLGETLIEKSGMAPEAVDELSKQVQALRKALADHR